MRKLREREELGTACFHSSVSPFHSSELNDLVQIQQKQVAAWTEDRQKVKPGTPMVQLIHTFTSEVVSLLCTDLTIGREMPPATR